MPSVRRATSKLIALHRKRLAGGVIRPRELRRMKKLTRRVNRRGKWKKRYGIEGDFNRSLF